MTTLQPRPPYSDDELARLYPSTLQLQQVQILLRHGERTPVSARFKNAGLNPFWPYCAAAKQMRSVMLNADGSWGQLEWKRRLEVPGTNDRPILSAGPGREVDAVCQPGELTDLGRQTTLALGQRIRNLYVAQLGFMPPILDAKASLDVSLRSTPIPRAVESTQQAFNGLYPLSSRAAGLPPPVIVQRAMHEETLFPNEGACKRLDELARAFADRTAELRNGSPDMKYINQKIGKWMPKDNSVVRVDSHPRLSGIMDTVNATLAHGPATRLPSEFYDPMVIEKIDRICVEEWFVGYLESEQYRKLGIGALVGDLTQRMVESATGQAGSEGSDFKLKLAGCHDTTIASTLAALGAFDVTKDKWPNYTSNIAFELFQRKASGPSASSPAPAGAFWPSQPRKWWSSFFSSSVSAGPSARLPLSEMPSSSRAKLDDYYVRLRYNDHPVTLPYCKQPGRHWEGDESFCTLAAFKQAADKITPRDWKTECKSNLGAPALPAVAERPPGLLVAKSASFTKSLHIE